METKFMIERTVEDILILKLQGELDALIAPKIKENLDKYIENKRVKIVIDFEDVQHINSLVMGILRGKLRECKELGGDIKLVGLSEHIKTIFEMVGLDELFEVYSSEKEAIESF